MKVVAIIQARMGSTRLPGKVLMDIAGKPMLQHVVERVERVARINRVVVATSMLPGDDAVSGLCSAHGWVCGRGSESDVLDRYYQVAKRHGADVVVRVTADCPLLEPGIIDRVIATLVAEDRADYASNVLEPRTFPRGLDVEAFRFSALERAWRESVAQIYREHVTTYLWQQPELFELRGVWSPCDLSAHRWTVDTPDDLALVREIYASSLPDEPSLERTVVLLAARPDLQNVNALITQKPLVP